MKAPTLIIIAMAALSISQSVNALPKPVTGNAKTQAGDSCAECLQNAVNKLGGESVHCQAKSLLNHVVYYGQSVNQGSSIWSQTVLLRMTINGKAMQCSGAILSDGMILTAAHCLKGASQVALEFRSADGSLVKAVPAEKFMFNDGFKENNASHDLGLVKFSGGLPKGFVATEMTRKIFDSGDKVVFAGFGKTENDSMGALKMAEGSVVLEDEGAVRVAGKGSSAGCGGDSGGPGFYEEDGKLKLFGVVSGGSIACNDGITVFSSASRNSAWIRVQTKRMNENAISLD